MKAESAQTGKAERTMDVLQRDRQVVRKRDQATHFYGGEDGDDGKVRRRMDRRMRARRMN